VRLVYVDEAGLSNAAQEPFLVVGGVIVHADGQLLTVEDRLDQLVNEWIPADQQEGFVFHAKELFNGGGRVFRRDDHRLVLTVVAAQRGIDAAFVGAHLRFARQVGVNDGEDCVGAVVVEHE
jgi:hypothetical protein